MLPDFRITAAAALTVVASALLSQPVAAQHTFEDVAASAFELAAAIEHRRTLPNHVDLPSASVDAAQWLQLAALAVLNIAGTDTKQPPRGTWILPDHLYPETVLDQGAYGHALARADYLAFLQQIVANHADATTLPPTIELNGAPFRFVDAVHLVASLLRFHTTFGYLPAVVDPKVATPIGLFPWDAPPGKETYRSAFQNDNGAPYSLTNEYYKTSVLDFEPYALAHELVGSIADPYTAGELIYDWSFDRYNDSPYGLNFDIDNLTGFVDDSWEMVRYMQGTSGKPSSINRGLFVSAGLVHGYDYRGYGGALYTDEHGWYNAEIHAGYGDDLSDNALFWFQGKDPTPQGQRAVTIAPDDSFLESVRVVTAKEGPIPTVRAFWINPADVDRWGAQELVDAAQEGGFTSIVLTVKSFVGRLYFDTGSADNIGWDALRPLLTAASGTSIEVLAAFNLLTDYESGMADEWGQATYGGGEPNAFFISPCVPAYQTYLKRLITSLYARYQIDGVVFARNYVHTNAWANPECGMPSGTDDGVKETYMANIANALASHVKLTSADTKVFYVTAPLVDVTGSAIDQYSHDATASRLSANDIDGVVLALHGLAWLTDVFDGAPHTARQVRDQMIDGYADDTSIPLMTMVHLSKEWMYDPAFYRGLARSYAAQGLSGVVLTAVNSAEGEYGPAFEKQHFAKLREIRFADPPPVPEFVTSRASQPADTPTLLSLIGAYPNPASDALNVRVLLNRAATVTIHIYDVLGREVNVSAQSAPLAGTVSLPIDTSRLAVGMYHYRVQAKAAGQREAASATIVVAR